MHSKNRDANSISHHYDVSNTFYEWVLGPTMAYTCACYPTADATLEEAQEYKFDLVARKIGLKPGMRLLDVGCGWGGMVMHAAREYGVKAIGVTLSAAAGALGAAGHQEARASRTWPRSATMDYRDVPETDFDAISSIGITEHIGKANVPGYFNFLNGKLKDGGRMLNHCITRPDNTGPSIYKDGFINRYVFPDGELEGPGWLAGVMNDNGFEIRHEENLREHYSKTLEGLVRQPRRALGRGGRGGRPGHGPRLAALHGGLAARLRPQRGAAAPDPRRQAAQGRDVGHAAAPRLGARGRAGEDLASRQLSPSAGSDAGLAPAAAAGSDDWLAAAAGALGRVALAAQHHVDRARPRRVRVRCGAEGVDGRELDRGLRPLLGALKETERHRVAAQQRGSGGRSRWTAV